MNKKAIVQKLQTNDNIEYVHALNYELSMMGNDNGELGFRCAGSSGERHTIDRIIQEMKAIGLQNITQDTFPVQSWEPLRGELSFCGIKIPMSSYGGASGTPKEGITAEIVDVGKGSSKEYEGKDVKDKIVFCSFDPIEDYWINYPAEQARNRGAVGIVCCYTGENYSMDPDRIASFDVQGISGFPVGNISRNSGAALREKLTEGPVEGNMTLDIIMDMNGSSSNITGFIPGKDPNKMIVLAGHLDGFFHTYQDDVLAVSINLSIAKAIIESGYQPEHTIAIVAHGSEEYGATPNHYDWCIGSWYQVNRLHPEWFGKVVAFLNIDAVRPDTPAYTVAATPEWKTYLGEFVKTMGQPPESTWPEGVKIIPPKGPWADGYNYSNAGIPELLCGGGPSKWSTLYYHTDGDNASIFESERELIGYVASNYAEIALAMDELVLPPLDYHYSLEGIVQTLENIPSGICESEKTALTVEARHAIDEATALYGNIARINDGDLAIAKNKADDLRKDLLACYKLIHKELMGLTPFEACIHVHEAIAENIKCISSALQLAETNKLDEVPHALWWFDLFLVAWNFDKEVYAVGMNMQDCKRQDLFWGTGKLHPFADLSKLVSLLKQGGSKAEIVEELNALLDFETAILKETLKKEQETVKQLRSKMKTIHL